MSDDYEPAITDTSTADTGVESAPVEKRAAEAPVVQAGEAGDDPNAPPGRDPRPPRVVSDKTRAMFKAIAEKYAKSDGLEGTTEDLVPMGAEVPPPAKPAAAAGAAPTPTAVIPAIPAAVPTATPDAAPVDVARAALEQARVAQEAKAKEVEAVFSEREKQFAAREAALAEREKLLPDRAAILEKPAAALVSWLKDTHGISTADEVKIALQDLLTEVSEAELGVQLPSELKTSLESRKALRVLKAHQDRIAREQKTFADKRAAEEKAMSEARAKRDQEERERLATVRVAQQLEDPALRSQFKFLHDPTLTGGADPAAIIIDVVKQQIAVGHKADWKVAAEYADNYFKTQAEERAKHAAHLQSLLAPPAPAAAPAAAPVAAPAAAAAPGGASGPAPAARSASQEAPDATKIDDPDEQPLDRHERRARSLRALARRHGMAAQ